MRMRRILIATLVAITTIAIGAVAASAQTLNTGEFEVTMPMPGEAADGSGKEPDCTPAIRDVAMTGGTAKCTMNRTLTGDSASGTVKNATLAAQYGEGFNNGTMTHTCDLTQNMTMEATFTAGSMTSMSPPKMTMAGTMVMGCSYKMSFTDAQASTLSGTMTLNASMSKNDLEGAGITGADIQMTLKVDVTEGTGVFAGYTGSGELDAAQAFSLLGGGAGGAGGAGGGAPSGGGSTPPSGGGFTPPSGGGSGLSDAQRQAICDALASMGGPPASSCTWGMAAAACTSRPNRGTALDTACAAAGRRGAATRQSTNADTMTLKLVKTNGKGTVRIISPVAGTGKNIAKVTAKTKVKIVATKGAQCTVKASTGKVVGKATSKDSAKTITMKAAKGSFEKAKWIQATCTIDGKSFSSTKVKIKT